MKKPHSVDAIKWNRTVFHPEVQIEPVTGKCFLPTLENQRLYLTEGCWIVGPGAKGEYWPVDNEVFEASYEQCEN